jgi:hypothetical protein
LLPDLSYQSLTLLPELNEKVLNALGADASNHKLQLVMFVGRKGSTDEEGNL